MRLFGKDPWAADGVRTVATIERVMVTEIGVGGSAQQADDDQVVHLAFRFTDEQGMVVVRERRCNLKPEKIPAPGWSVLVVYVAGKPETVDYDPRAMRPPDPRVPRGWGAGIFEVEDLGTHHSKSPFAKRTIDRQRELFRSGSRAQAEIVSVDAPAYRRGLRLQRGAAEITLRLRVDGDEIETKAWVPAACVPEPRDLIEVAISADRSEVALDSDERYDGPPGQALVFTASPGLAAEAPPQPPIDVEANRPWTAERVSEDNASRHAKLMAAATEPPGQQRQEDPRDHLARLSGLLNRGAITKEQYAALEANLLANDAPPVEPSEPGAVAAPGAAYAPRMPANLQSMLAESAKDALARITDPAQRQVVIQQYRLMGIEIGADG
jgi:hypothetical protein